ncbi:MAG: glycerol kinase GlpK [Actinomycetota bacterium]|nr:glycerol kinase GlpK [Actinomycetota bacterium]
MKEYILAIDQGTTGTTAIVFSKSGVPLSKRNVEFTQYFPSGGWVEHDPEEIWKTTLSSVEAALSAAGIGAGDLCAIGITNQRETSVFWKRESLEPVGRAIVWQCRRSAGICDALKREGLEEKFQSKTGLVIDPYFSGTKIKWKMDNDPEFARMARNGEICFGTIDSWLLARLTGGRVHATDLSNASRTLLFNINELTWDEEIIQILGIPPEILPEVCPSSFVFGETDPTCFFGESVPIAGVAGDQQAALFGQACYKPGMAKNTYGTGSFVVMNTGGKPVPSKHGMLTTIAWGLDGKVDYALEGSIFITGAALQWLRDGLGIIKSASEAGPLAEKAGDNGGLYFVPALVGMGAPYWDPYARGAILGITRGTTKEQLVRATVEAMAYQTRDVIDAMRGDSGIDIRSLRVDGGASVMDVLLEFQADLLGIAVERPVVQETTALGAAFLAGLAVGLWKNLSELQNLWGSEKIFEPHRDKGEMDVLYRRWRKAVERARNWENPELDS